MKALVNVIGYVKVDLGKAQVIMPYIAKEEDGVYVLNNYGNAVFVQNKIITFLDG